MTPTQSQSFAVNPELLHFGVQSDFVDLRDKEYKAPLSKLNSSHNPLELLQTLKPDGRRMAPAFKIRSQNTGRCVGYALAALIDIQRQLQSGDPLHPKDISLFDQNEHVSADMLYHMARFHEQYARNGLKKTTDNPAPVTSQSRNGGVRSLRSVIKAFYHHGVCLDYIGQNTGSVVSEERWQSTTNSPTPVSPQEEQKYPSVAQAKSARSLTLGAYYRLHPFLNDYHSAISETATILVSANIHHGWAEQNIKQNNGRIVWSETNNIIGTHAFVIVGYNNEGFLILNSWGEEWGGYNGYAGVALWTYADWARNIVDGWVLRLGVPTPGAFNVSIGKQGTSNIYHPVRAGSTPCLELMGHFLHLDDGHFVDLGAYPSTSSIMETTLTYLDEILPFLDDGSEEKSASKPTDSQHQSNYKGVLLWIPGSLEGIKAIFEQSVARNKLAKDMGLYPITLFWCLDFVKEAMDLLGGVFKNCEERYGAGSPHLDQAIEANIRGVGRAFWREVECSARRAIWGTGEKPGKPCWDKENHHATRQILELVRIAKCHGTQLHIVVEGAGVLVLDELLELLERYDSLTMRKGQNVNRKDFCKVVKTLSLSLPSIDIPRASERIIPFIAHMNNEAKSAPHHPVFDHVNFRKEEKAASKKKKTTPKKGSNKKERTGWHKSNKIAPARIYIPNQAIEARISVAEYGKSILHLMANAFEDRRDDKPHNNPKPILGMAGAKEIALQNFKGKPAGLKHSFSRISSLSLKPYELGKVDQYFLTRDANLEIEIHKSIEAHC